MISAQKLVEEMLRPLNEVYSLMLEKLSPKSVDHEVEKAFILHREQWNFLAQAYSRTVGEIRSQLLRMLEPLMATLHALFSVMKAAQKSFLECVAPHVGFSISRFIWLQSAEKKQMRDLRLWMVKDALRHILDSEIPPRHLYDLLTVSTAVYEALLHVNYLNLLGDARRGKDLPPIYMYSDDAALPNGIPVIYTGDPLPGMEDMVDMKVMDDDVASARRFFSSSVANQTDPYLSQMIVERLGGSTMGEKLAAGIGRLKLNPTQFTKTDRKLRVLGKGHFGTVKLRNWISDKHQVAVKRGTIRSEEMEIQERIRHPNVLPLLCCTWKEEEANDEKSLLLVMERMDCNLDHLIDDASSRSGDEAPPLPLSVSVEIMLQIAKGMDYLHDHDIMHRGLKPANILVSCYDSTSSDDPLQFLRVKVADFGASRDNFQTFDTRNSYKVGSGFYRAPEVMDEESNEGYSRKADVYSFGMVCYRILTGKEPFRDCDSLSLRYLHKEIQKGGLRPKLEFESTHSMALVGMIKHCWRSKTAERPDFVQIAAFLRFIKMCVLQQSMMFCRGSEWRHDLDELLKSADLFSTFCQRGSTTEEMIRIYASRKILI